MKIILNKYKHQLNFPLDDADINQICVYLENRQIKKLAYEYGNKILDIALEWCINKEDYECCSAIQKYINEVDKYSK